MKLNLNEKEMIRKSLEEGYIDKKPTNTIKLLIKHYYNLGMDRHQVRQSIDDFLKRHLPRFNPVKWDKILDTLVKKEEKQEHKLIEIEKIHITKNELEMIRNIDNLNLEKLAFSYLVYSKLFNQINDNQSNWVNAPRKDVFQDSKIIANAQKQRLLVNDLINLGLIESSKKRNCSNKKVLFVDETSDIGIVITDFREFVYEYLKWNGDKIGDCRGCGKLFKVNRNTHKYCAPCAKIQKNELNKLYYHKKNESLGK